MSKNKPISVQEYRQLITPSSPTQEEKAAFAQAMKQKHKQPMVLVDPVPAAALRAMGAYFELEPKAVEFYIRQQQLSKKIKS